jgi:hypothetical protein
MRWNNRTAGRRWRQLGVLRYLGLTLFALSVCNTFNVKSPLVPAALAQKEASKDRVLPKGVQDAIAYIAREHDRFHRHGFIIYDDHDSGGCHMFPSLWMGDLVPSKPEPAWVSKIFNEQWTNNPAEGNHCLRVEYPRELALRGDQMWVACGWQSPKDAQGKLIQYDLRRFVFPDEAVKLTFQVRGQQGDERAEFRVFADDRAKLLVGLTKQWERKSLLVSPRALAGPITECFVWASNNSQNPRGSVFFLDDIKIQFGPKGRALRLAEPRFIRSYFAQPKNDPDKYFRNACYVYDQALAISALVATGQLARAALLADALVYATEHDRLFKDHRLRNAYLCGDVAGLGRNGPSGPTRLPGWWDAKEQKWFEDTYFAGSDCGNTAWAIIGLLNYWQATGKKADSIYLKTAVRLGKWVDKYAFSTEGAGGFYGGLEGFEQTKGGALAQARSPWKSTEHAIDLYCAYTRLARATGQARFLELAKHADSFIQKMWNKKDGHLFTGTEKDGKTVSIKPIPLDAQAWSILAFRDAKRFGPAIAWADANCRVALADELFGYDFDTDKDGAGWEGTAQMCLSLRFLGEGAKASTCLKALRTLGLVQEPKEARGAIYAASRDGLTTGFTKNHADGPKADPWLYYRRPHLGATCWYVYAELGWNPYWGEYIR